MQGFFFYYFNLLIAASEKIQFDVRICNDASVQGGQDRDRSLLY